MAGWSGPPPSPPPEAPASHLPSSPRGGVKGRRASGDSGISLVDAEKNSDVFAANRPVAEPASDCDRALADRRRDHPAGPLHEWRRDPWTRTGPGGRDEAGRHAPRGVLSPPRPPHHTSPVGNARSAGRPSADRNRSRRVPALAASR